MTDTTIAQSEPVLVAIDISKARHEVLIAVSGKKRRRRPCAAIRSGVPFKAFKNWPVCHPRPPVRF
jgi:hypothetical protein